jgi:diguanylate cyclase (GGDEF)-like protein/PAS domain S-box-containing protein
MTDKDKTKEETLKELLELREQNQDLHQMLKGMAQAADELRDHLEKYMALIESTDDSIYLVDKKARYLFMNKKHLARMGLRIEELLGKGYGDFHSQDETGTFVHQVDTVFKTGESCQYEHRSVRDGGYFLRTLSPVAGSSDTIKAVTVISKNITSLKTLEAELYALSLADELTSLYNRRGFLTLSEQQIKIARRMKQRLLLIYADMNEMKKINDTFGHAKGDEAIKALAEILKNTFRESDIIARIGGDEFAILATTFRARSERTYMERLKANIDAYNAIGKCPYLLSISTGIFICDPLIPCGIEEMLVAADKRMYEQKSALQRSRS